MVEERRGRCVAVSSAAEVWLCRQQYNSSGRGSAAAQACCTWASFRCFNSSIAAAEEVVVEARPLELVVLRPIGSTAVLLLSAVPGHYAW